MTARDDIKALGEKIGQSIIGQEAMVERLLLGLLSDGHLLVEGLPGLAKTRAIKSLAKNLDAKLSRVQFTPDLLPADITGSEIYYSEGGKGEFKFQPGPVFANLVLADEINRAPAKVQSALLEAMEERQVTVGGESHGLPELFLVMATQNPIEQEGTYPLPEAQLDRFLVQVDVAYPDRETERRILLATTGAEEGAAVEVFTPEALIAAQALVRRMPVGETVVEAILTLVRACRPGEDEALPLARETLAWGPGPRAAQALMLMVRARALLNGRLAPSLEDVAALAGPVLVHRMALNFSARARGETLAGVIAQAVALACPGTDEAEAAA